MSSNAHVSVQSHRIAYSKQTYMEALEPKQRQLIADAEKEPSLSALVQVRIRIRICLH